MGWLLCANKLDLTYLPLLRYNNFELGNLKIGWWTVGRYWTDLSVQLFLLSQSPVLLYQLAVSCVPCSHWCKEPAKGDEYWLSLILAFLIFTWYSLVLCVIFSCSIVSPKWRCILKLAWYLCRKTECSHLFNRLIWPDEINTQIEACHPVGILTWHIFNRHQLRLGFICDWET